MTNKTAEDSMLTEASDDCAESDLGYLIRAVGKGEIGTSPASRQAVCILRRAMKDWHGCVASDPTSKLIRKWTTKDERKKALVMLAWSNARRAGVELCPECLRLPEWSVCGTCEGEGDEFDEDCNACEGSGGYNSCRCGWSDEK